MTPPAEISDNIFAMSEAVRKQNGIDSLPGSLQEAIGELERDELLVKVLGEHIFTQYVSGKKAEWDEYRTQVSTWELKRYMKMY